MNSDTTNPVPLLTVIEIDCHAQYNQAIDDACFALNATGNEEGWAIVRSLREPKIPLEE